MTGYCKWCDSLTDDIVQDINSDTGAVVWVGCLSCKLKQVERGRKSMKKVPTFKDWKKRL